MAEICKLSFWWKSLTLIGRLCISWLGICQLFAALTGVISKSPKKLSQTRIGLVGTSYVIKRKILSILAISDFSIPVANRQFLIKVWTYVISLSCLLRTMLEYQKVRQVWTLQYGIHSEVCRLCTCRLIFGWRNKNTRCMMPIMRLPSAQRP